MRACGFGRVEKSRQPLEIPVGSFFVISEVMSSADEIITADQNTSRLISLEATAKPGISSQWATPATQIIVPRKRK